MPVGTGKIKVITPPGGYFAFSWRSPEASDLWAGSGGRPVTIYENGSRAGWVSYERKDGPDGDPAFNPYGVADADPTDFTYTYYVPRVTVGHQPALRGARGRLGRERADEAGRRHGPERH